MKNYLKGSLVLLLAVFSLYSCNDDSASNQNLDDGVLGEVAKTSNTYKKLLNIDESNEGKTTYSWKKFFRVLGADLTGATAGAGFAGPVGAVFGGAGASILVAVTDKGYQGYEPQGLDGNYYNVNNPFDYSGIIHYTLIDEGLEPDSGVIYDDESQLSTSFFNFSKNYAIKNKVFNPVQVDALSYNTYVDIYTIGINSSDLRVKEKVELISDFSSIGVETKEIMIEYLSCLESSDKVEDFKRYSIAIEEIIVNNEDKFSQKEFAMLLSGMSVARIGYDYWDRQTNR